MPISTANSVNRAKKRKVSNSDHVEKGQVVQSEEMRKTQ